MAEHLYLQKKDSLMTAITFLSVFTHLTRIRVAKNRVLRRLLASKLNLVIISACSEFRLVKSCCFCRIDWTVIKIQSATPHNTLKSRIRPKSPHQHLCNCCLKHGLDAPLDFFFILIFTRFMFSHKCKAAYLRNI